MQTIRVGCHQNSLSGIIQTWRKSGLEGKGDSCGCLQSHLGLTRGHAPVQCVYLDIKINIYNIFQHFSKD